jgi:hypothetical protein
MLCPPTGWFVVYSWDRFARGKMALLETVLSPSGAYARRAIKRIRPTISAFDNVPLRRCSQSLIPGAEGAAGRIIGAIDPRTEERGSKPRPKPEGSILLCGAQAGVGCAGDSAHPPVSIVIVPCTFGEVGLLRAIAIHHENLVVAVPIAIEGDLLAIRREGGILIYRPVIG